MAFPDDLEWNQPGVEPTQAKKNEGWKPEEKPPAEYFNWFFNRTSQAVKYLKGESDKSVDDVKIGNRTITDTTTAVAGANTLTKLLSMLGNMIKQITGKSAWYTAPATTLEVANGHINSTSNPHVTTASQVGAIPNTAGSVSATNLAAGAAVANGAAPGNYGLGANAKNVETSDINTIIVTGWYSGWGDTKTPSPGAGYTLRVDSRNANFDHATQEIAHDAIPNMRWTRSCASGVWSSWKQIATSDQIPTTAAQVGAAPDGFGLGKPNPPSATNLGFTDLNGLVITGFYRVNHVEINRPEDYGNLIVYGNTDEVTQMFTGVVSRKTYIRGYQGGVWSAWKQLATTDITFINRGDPPADWNSAVLSGAYMVHPEHPTGQANTAIIALGMYPYGQLLVSTAENNQTIQQTYYTHRGEVAIRMLYSGSAWSPWRQLANTDSIPAGASAVKAHVNFGYEGGVVTIRNSFNISSVVRTSGGQYTINFATPLASANYTFQCTAAGLGTGVGQGLVVSEYMSAANVYGTKTTNAIAIITVTNNDSDKTVADVGSCNVTILQ